MYCDHWGNSVHQGNCSNCILFVQRKLGDNRSAKLWQGWSWKCHLGGLTDTPVLGNSQKSACKPLRSTRSFCPIPRLLLCTMDSIEFSRDMKACVCLPFCMCLCVCLVDWWVGCFCCYFVWFWVLCCTDCVQLPDSPDSDFQVLRL